MRTSWLRSTAYIRPAAVALMGAFLLAACGNTSTSSSNPNSSKALRIAYLSFAVANSYDAPMLAAAQTAASDNNAKLTVFDANNNPQTQFAQLQDAIGSGQYDGIVVQPIFGTGLVDLVRQAIAKGIKVVNMDQILGPDLTTDQPQVPGLSANVTFVPTDIGQKLGQLVVQACTTNQLNPCNVGYLFDIKASALDVAINQAFTKAISSSSAIKVVAEGESFFTPAIGLKAAQNMLAAHPDLNLIVGSDQGIEGSVQALVSAGKKGKIVLVGYGGGAAGLQGVASGDWFGDVAQTPASEGRLAVIALTKALRSGANSGGIDPVAQLPNGGVVTKANAAQFTAEWPG